MAQRPPPDERGCDGNGNGTRPLPRMCRFAPRGMRWRPPTLRTPPKEKSAGDMVSVLFEFDNLRAALSIGIAESA